MRVLIVDDDEIAVSLLRCTLEAAGHEVLAAGDGREAMDILQREKLRLVISDWEMPHMTGPELCRAIRTGRFPRYIYVILVTARRSTEDIVRGLTAGADDFITKPFQPAELTVRVRTGERILSLETRDLAIFAMAKLAESRDSETGAHLERVRNYARLLALELASACGPEVGIDDEFAQLIYLTSPLHDIGKVAIPDSILLKPGRLTAEEFAIMKTHTTRGAETLDAAIVEHPDAKFLHMARDIALCHHEQYSGAGYPRGLVGDAIPLCARIVSVADTYDAITSRRVYKEAHPHESAEAEIVKQSGRQFDPRVVEAFRRVADRFAQIARTTADPMGGTGLEPVTLSV